MKQSRSHLKDGHPSCPSLRFSFIHKEGIDAKGEDNVSAKEILQALKQQVFCLQFVHEPAVDEEGNVEDDVAKEADDDEGLPAVVLGERAGKESEEDGWPALKQPIVTLGTTFKKTGYWMPPVTRQQISAA